MNYRDKDRATKKWIYIVNIIIIFICILWWLGGYISTLMIADKMNNISQLLQGGTMLLYTLYIPIAIAILQYFLDKKYIPSINIKTLLKRVFNIKTHILLILASILAVILIDIENRFFISLGIFIWIVSSIKIIFDLKETNSFITSLDKSKYWFDFLSKTNEKDFVEGIVDIFGMAPNEIEEQIEKESKDKVEIGDNDIRNYTQWNDTEKEDFINLILDKIEEYKVKYNYNAVYSIFNIVNKNTSKINFNYRNQLFITKLFEYIYIFLKESEESAEHNGSPSKYIEAHEIYRISEEILIKILQKSLQDPHPSSATIDFFEALDQHLQKYKDETIQFHGKEKSYFEFFKYFGDRVITEILNSKDVFVARDVLDYHWSKSDRNWKINLSNLESEKDNKITYYWLNRMLEYLYNTWKEQIFYTSTKKLESKDIQKVNILLNSFTHNIDVILFMRVVELVWFKRVVNENVKNYLEKRVFWFLDNVEMYIDNSSPEENLEYEKIIIEKQQRETVLLLKKIYKLNDNFYKDIKSQIEAIDRNSLDDEQKGRLESLQKTIDYFINNK